MKYSFLVVPACLALAFSCGGETAQPGTSPADVKGDDPPAGLDPSQLEACCPEHPGTAHCVPDELIPAEFVQFSDLAAACAGGGRCIPDVLIEAGGPGGLAHCSAGGSPGRCVSLCIPAVAQNAGALPVDSCDPEERCVPCLPGLCEPAAGSQSTGGSCAVQSGGRRMECETAATGRSTCRCWEGGRLVGTCEPASPTCAIPGGCCW